MSTNQSTLDKLKAGQASQSAAPKTAPTNVAKQAESKKEALQIQVLQDKKFHVFYNTISSCKMLTDSGRVIAFVDGRYVTDQEEEIEYLQREIANSDNIYLSVVKGKEVMTSTELDPMKMLRKKHFEELVAMQKAVARKLAAGEPLSQSESEVQALTPGSTSDIADLAADSGL